MIILFSMGYDITFNLVLGHLAFSPSHGDKSDRSNFYDFMIVLLIFFFYIRTSYFAKNILVNCVSTVTNAVWDSAKQMKGTNTSYTA